MAVTKIERIKRTDNIKNEEVLKQVKEGKSLLHAVMKRKADWLGHILWATCIQKVTEQITGKRSRGRKKTWDTDGFKRVAIL